MAKPSAASRTLDLFGSPLPPSFGGKGIVAFEDRPESNKMPLFGHNLVEKGFGTLPVVAKPQPVAAKPQKKTKLRKPPKRKKIGSARVNRRVAANLAKRLAEARAELAQCQARSTRSSSRSSSKRAGTPKKSGPTRKQLVARILSLQEQLAACEGRSSTVERTSITDANVEPDEVFRIAFEPDYDDPIEHSLAETERAEVAQTDAARKTKKLVAHGNTNQRLAAVAARKDGPLADAGDDEGHVSERVQQLLAEATEAERKAVELAELIVRGPGETKALAEKKHALDKRAIELRAKALRLQEYSNRQTAKAWRLSTRAAEMRSEAHSLESQNRRLGDTMAGTPILVGHHSEKRHRRDIERINDRTRKAIGLTEQAEKVERRAANAVGGTAIRADDPDAVWKLEEKLKVLESEFERLHGFRRVNARQEIARVRARIEQLKENEKKAGKSAQIGDAKIEWNAEVNRIQIRFPDKPGEDLRERLKSYGFKWAPSQLAWQRLANDNAWYAALAIVKDFFKPETES